MLEIIVIYLSSESVAKHGLLKTIRRTSGILQKQVAETMNVSASYVSQLEKRPSPSLQTIKIYADLTDKKIALVL